MRKQYAAGLVVLLAMCVSAMGALPKAPVLSPSGLDADRGDGKVYLEWNRSTEPEVTGHNVYRWSESEKEKTKINGEVMTGTVYVDATANNDVAYQYGATAVFKGGESRISPAARAVVVKDIAAKGKATKAGYTDVELPAMGGREKMKLNGVLKIAFANGHTMVFDTGRMKWRDWQSSDGQHLVYPNIYGNPVDLCSYDNMGFSVPEAATKEGPALPPRINFDYGKDTKAQTAAKWLGYDVDGQRVTLSYRIPLWGPGMPADAKNDTWVWGKVRETWFPVERDVNGTKYSGLARRLEITTPSYFNETGYSVALNDGFGVEGSCEGATTYRPHSWTKVSAEILTWKRGENQSERGKVREAQNFHPTETALQTHPFLFIDHPKGTLIITARRQNFCTTFRTTNYAEQGHDGLWPNFQIDIGGAGGALGVDTFEYLYSSDRSAETPQRFMDAKFYFYRRMAELYDLPKYLPAITRGTTLYWTKDKAVEAAVNQAKSCEEKGIDLFMFYHPLWMSASHAMDEEYLTNPKLPDNIVVKEMAAAFAAKGVKMGYWFRPEFVLAPRANVLSDAFFTPYYGYSNQVVPPLIPLLEKRGLPLVRSHPEWMRKGRDGTYPAVANYNWTPMSMTGGWLNEMVWSTFKMSGELGCKTVFFDGGYGGMSGVDFTSGKAEAVQPHWWRLFRLMKEAGLDTHGECGVNFGGAYDFGPVGVEPGEMPWFYANAAVNPTKLKDKEEAGRLRHRVHQMYGAVDMPKESGEEEHAATKFFAEFLKKNGPPDRVVMKGLRNEGGKWIYDGVDWMYADGRKVEYPNTYKVQ